MAVNTMTSIQEGAYQTFEQPLLEHVLWTFGVIWFRVTSYSVAVCSLIYLLSAIWYIRRRVHEDARWIVVPLIYTLWGGLFSFLSAGTIAIAIGTAYIALHEAMTKVELWVYVGSLSLTFMYFSTGHIPILYTI